MSPLLAKARSQLLHARARLAFFRRHRFSSLAQKEIARVEQDFIDALDRVWALQCLYECPSI